MNKRFWSAVGSIVAALSVALVLNSAPASAAVKMNITKVKGMSSGLTGEGSATKSIATRPVTLYGVIGQPYATYASAYVQCWNTANPTAGTTVPTIEFLFTNNASTSNNTYFFPYPLTLGGTALTCGAYTLTNGSSTSSANLSLFWQ